MSFISLNSVFPRLWKTIYLESRKILFKALFLSNFWSNEILHETFGGVLLAKSLITGKQKHHCTADTSLG